MTGRYVAAISILLVLCGLIVYGVRTGTGQQKKKNDPQTAQKSPAKQETQGHDTAAQQQPAEQGEEAPTVEIPVDKQQMLGVKTTEAAVRTLGKVIRTVGRIEYDERKLSTINTKFEGWIEKLYIDYTGRHVRKGEPLAEIYSPELVATQQEFINMLKWKKQSGDTGNESMGKMLSKDAGVLIDAAKNRLRLWDISEEQIMKIEESGRPVRTLTLYSPVNGFVVQKTALQGMKVMPGEKLFDIADLSSVWVIADIYEFELPFISIGQTAAISLSYFPGKIFSSKIEYVYPTLSGDTRTAKVRFSISNPGEKLKAQMFTNVEIKINLGAKLSVPDDAVIDTGERQVVYVDKGDGYFEPREVTLGVRAEGYREVLAGLRAGDKVASSATFLIDSEAQLKNVKPLSGHKH